MMSSIRIRQGLLTFQTMLKAPLFIKTTTFLVALVLYSRICTAQETDVYFLKVGETHLDFMPRPDLGYVAKSKVEQMTSTRLEDTLRDHGAKDIMQVRGQNRRGLSIVFGEHAPGENQRIIKRLRDDGSIDYVAPLFYSNECAVAIIPEIVVRLRSVSDDAGLQLICNKMGLTIKHKLEFTDCEYLIEISGVNAEAVFSAVKQLSDISYIAWACPNTAFQPQLYSPVVPNDVYFLEQWHLHNVGQKTRLGSQGITNADINAPEAWEISTGHPNIIIAVPDTGVDLNHPDLVANLVPGYDFLDDDNWPQPSNNGSLDAHGTACAGLIASQGNNGVGVTGVSWNCKIMPIRIEAQNRLCTDADIATAFRWMADNGADVITNSWGWGYAAPITHSAIIDITKPGGMGREGKGCVVVGAAGNAGTNSVMYIARYPEVIAVGATDNRDQRWYYSNYGPDLDLVAPSGGRKVEDIPGGFLCSTDISGFEGVNNEWLPDVYGPLVSIGEDYRVCMGGTSGASPIVAGVAGLILSVDPDLTNNEVRDILQQSAKDLGTPGFDNYYGHGRVDARAALEIVLRARGDFNFDQTVDMKDFSILAQYWLSNEPSVDISPLSAGDGIVDCGDLAAFVTHWLNDIHQ